MIKVIKLFWQRLRRVRGQWYLIRRVLDGQPVAYNITVDRGTLWIDPYGVASGCIISEPKGDGIYLSDHAHAYHCNVHRAGGSGVVCGRYSFCSNCVVEGCGEYGIDARGIDGGVDYDDSNR